MSPRQLEKANAPRVLVLSQFYWPEPAFYATSIAEHLVDQAGVNVHVVTGFPNRPGGRIFPGYRQGVRFRESRRGVSITRVPLVINHSARAAERLANFLSFAASATTVLKLAREADVIYVYATPMTTAVPAQIWKVLFRTPYVLHVQDLWPESVTGSGMLNSRVLRASSALLRPWLRNAYKHAAHICAISPGMQQMLIERGAEEAQTSVVFNWADEENLVKANPGSGSRSRTVLGYAGNLGRMQDLGTVVEAVKAVSSVHDIELRIAGDGVEEGNLKQLAEGFDNVQFLGRIDRTEIHELYRKSDFQMVTLRDMPIFRVTVPSKLQASLASGVPVITTVQGDVGQLIEEYGAGLVATPEDVNSLVGVLERAASTTIEDRRRMGENARRLYDDLMGRRVGLRAIQDVLLFHAERTAQLRSSGTVRRSRGLARLPGPLRPWQVRRKRRAQSSA